MSITARWALSFDRRRGGVLGTEPTRGGTGAAPDTLTPGDCATAVAVLRAVAEGDDGVVEVAA